MPNPTTYWAWPLPSENADPWYDAFQEFAGAIDTTVRSIESGLVPRATVVLSVMPIGSMAINSSTMVSRGADGHWAIASVAPYGRFVGSFALVTSGAQANWHLTIAGLNRSAGVPALTDHLIVRFRAVVQRTGVSSLVVPNNSGWLFIFNPSNVHQQMVFTALTSLGPGNYSAEIQASTTAQVGSTWSMNEYDRAMLIVTEVRRGD